MSTKYRERPQQPLCKFEEIQWEGTKLFQQGMVLWACWPVENEPLMWQIAQCHVCRHAPAHWVGIGDPFNDGGQYFCENAAFCYWCFPREHFTEEELRLARHGEWARKQTGDEIIEIIRYANLSADHKTVESALSSLIDEIREATKSQETRLQERAAWERLNGPAISTMGIPPRVHTQCPSNSPTSFKPAVIVRPRMKPDESLPFGWEIRETNGTFELWDRGRFYDDRGTRDEALKLIAEIEDGRPEEEANETKIQ